VKQCEVCLLLPSVTDESGAGDLQQLGILIDSDEESAGGSLGEEGRSMVCGAQGSIEEDGSGSRIELLEDFMEKNWYVRRTIRLGGNLQGQRPLRP
jgi:hypothetical protein